MTRRYQGELEIDSERGVIYFNSNGQTLLRICNLPRPIPFLKDTMLDITHMHSASWKGQNRDWWKDATIIKRRPDGSLR
jgi:hypothetical protein